MVVGIGIDTVEVRQFGERLTPELVEELFLADEIAYCRSQRYGAQNFAARFAAKEAAFKALGAGLEQGLRWHDVEVVRQPSGSVGLTLRGLAAEFARRQGVGHTLLSLSHTRQSAIAMVLMQNRAAAHEERP